MEGDESFICRRCDRPCDLRYEYTLEIESGSYPIRWFRCPSCRGEYLYSPELLATDNPWEPGIGQYREVSLCHATAKDESDEPGGRSVAPLVATALAEHFVDAVLLPDYGKDRSLRVVTEPQDATSLRGPWSAPSRKISVSAGAAANLDFLLALERFARHDGGQHSRIAVVGRPCHVYVARRAHLEKIAPGYAVEFALGLFCYGNISPFGSPALQFQKLTGLEPSQIRGMTVAEGKVRVVSADRQAVEVPLREFMSLLHTWCLKCVDFTVPWADLSVGESPQIEGFDVVLVRTDRGERLFRAARETGRLRAWSPPWMAHERDSLRILSDLTSVKRELQQLLR